MAIIEEISSDDEQAPQLRKQPLPTRGANVKSAEASSVPANAVQKLILKRQQPVQEKDVQALLASSDLNATWEDILVASKGILEGHKCDTINIELLERLSKAVALVHKLASPQQLADAVEASHATLDVTVTAICEALKVPPVFLKEEYNITSEHAQRQSFWLAGSTAVLELLQVLLNNDFVKTCATEDIETEARLVISLSKYLSSRRAVRETGHSKEEEDLDAWVTPLSSRIALNLLDNLLSTESDKSASRRHQIKLVKHILLSYVKPLFTSSPHPMLNPDTGRKLDRRRGGDLFGDSYIDGDWKGQSVQAEAAGAIGCWKVYMYLLTLIGKDDFEEIWPLLVPPMMTLLDDHQIYFKHQGIIAVSIFLSRTPAVLLMRTGLNDLIQQSLTTAYSFTSEVQNVSMIRDAIATNIQLVNLLYPKTPTTTPTSVAQSSFQHKSKRGDPPALVRFDTLSSIYHNCVINIFTYASSSIPYMTLAFQTIPILVDELGKGSIRFLGDTMTVLCSSLGGSVASKALANVFSKETVRMHIEASNAIIALINVCKDVGRIERWRGMILSSVATLWCNIKEQDHDHVSTKELQDTLKLVTTTLTRVCGDLAIVDCKRMQALDPALFSELFANAV